MKKEYFIDKQLLKSYNAIRDKAKRKYFCLAPFSTLLFTEYGEILPCYYNKNIVFGSYPKDDPSEVWFGEKMEALRSHILKNNLAYGCQDCAQYLFSKNYYSVGAWKYDYLPLNTSKYCIFVDVQPTNSF